MKRTTLSVLALAAVALAIAACSAGEEEAAGPSAGERPPAAEEPHPGEPFAREAGEDESAVAASARTLPPVGPRIIQTASLRLAVRDDGFEATVERARTTVSGLGGFVVSSTARQGGREQLVRGSLVVRVPARRYAEAMSALARLGRVQAREEQGQDVSQEFVDLEARASPRGGREPAARAPPRRAHRLGGARRPVPSQRGAAPARAGARAASVPRGPGRVRDDLARDPRALAGRRAGDRRRLPRTGARVRPRRGEDVRRPRRARAARPLLVAAAGVARLVLRRRPLGWPGLSKR